MLELWACCMVRHLPRLLSMSGVVWFDTSPINQSYLVHEWCAILTASLQHPHIYFIRKMASVLEAGRTATPPRQGPGEPALHTSICIVYENACSECARQLNVRILQIDEQTPAANAILQRICINACSECARQLYRYISARASLGPHCSNPLPHSELVSPARQKHKASLQMCLLFIKLYYKLQPR